MQQTNPSVNQPIHLVNIHVTKQLTTQSTITSVNQRIHPSIIFVASMSSTCRGTNVVHLPGNQTQPIRSLSQFANQPINLSNQVINFRWNNHVTNQPITQSTIQSIDQSTNPLSIIRSRNGPINPSIIQSANQSANQSVDIILMASAIHTLDCIRTLGSEGDHPPPGW